jgi:hypothetical protein
MIAMNTIAIIVAKPMIQRQEFHGRTQRAFAST